jgi:hypothetical protein
VGEALVVGIVDNDIEAVAVAVALGFAVASRLGAIDFPLRQHSSTVFLTPTVSPKA